MNAPAIPTPYRILDDYKHLNYRGLEESWTPRLGATTIASASLHATTEASAKRDPMRFSFKQQSRIPACNSARNDQTKSSAMDYCAQRTDCATIREVTTHSKWHSKHEP